MTDAAQFPKWVEVHSSHVGINSMGQQVPLGFDDCHFDRVSRKWTVLVKDSAEETKAGAPKS